MGAASVALGIGCLLFMLGGFLFTPIPFLGSFFAFTAPLMGLGAIVTGALAMSRAKREGMSSGAGIAGLVMGIIGFLFSLVVALTCGLCNAMCSSAAMSPNARINYRFGDASTTIDLWKPDGGAGLHPALPPPPFPPGPSPTEPTPAPAPTPTP